MSYLEDRQILGKVDLGMLRNGGRSDLTAIFLCLAIPKGGQILLFLKIILRNS